MKKILSKIAIASALFLGACSNDAPDIQAGNGGLKYVVSSNILNSEKETMVLDRESPIVFIMSDSLSQVTVSMSVIPGGALVPVRVRQSRDSVIVTSSTGTWDAMQYDLSLVGSFKNGVGVSFDLAIDREPGLNLVSSNVYDVANNTGYIQVPVSVGTLNYVFDQAVTTVELAKVYKTAIAPANEVASTSSMAGDTLKLALGVDSLDYNTIYVVTYRVRSATGNLVDKSAGVNFQTATSSFLAVASNVEVVGTAVGKPTFDFPLQGAITVTFSEAIDTDLRRLIWAAPGYDFDLGNSKGTVAGGLLEANVAISGNTLTVTPVQPLAGVANGNTVGFQVTVQSLRDRNLNTTVEVKATLRDNKLYVISTNVIDSLGFYRPFKVTGDSLVVTFSKAVKPEGFAVNSFVNNYTVAWSADSLTATIKNIDTLTAATYGAANPYTAGNGSTDIYTLDFKAKSADGTEDLGSLTISGYALEVHTEYALSLVNANVLEGHLDATVPVANEGYKDSLNTLSNVVLTFNRALDTTLINAWIAKDAQTDKFGYIYQSNNGNLKIPATLSISADGRTLTLDPVEALPITTDGSISGTKIEYKVQLLKLEAAGLRTADGIASYVLGSTATDATKRYFKLPKTAVDISAFNVTKLLMKDTVYMVGNTNHPKYYDSLSSEATLGAYNGSALKVRIMHPSLSKDSVQYYQYRAQVINKASVSQGWFYSTQQSAPAYRGLLDNAASLAAKASQAYSFTLLDGLKVLDLDGNGTEYTNGLDYFNQGSTIEIQVRGVRENDKDTSYTAWSNSITFKDNIAPCDPVHVSAANMNNTAAFGVAVARTVVQNGAAAAGSITYTFTFPEDMDVSMAPVITFKNTGSNEPVVNTATTKWTSARSYTAAFTLTAGINYSGVTYGIASVAGLKDASGVAIVSSGSITVANDGTVTGIPSDGSSTIQYGAITLVAP